MFLATAPVDGRKGIDGLSAIVRSQFGLDPFTGHLFVFLSRRADRVRVLYWDRNGYVLVTKRLEKGTFRMPVRADTTTHAPIESAELMLMLEGIDLRNAVRRPRWTPRVVHGQG